MEKNNGCGGGGGGVQNQGIYGASRILLSYLQTYNKLITFTDLMNTAFSDLRRKLVSILYITVVY